MQFMLSIAVDEFKKKLDTIYRSTELPSQFYSVHDNIGDIILKNLIREYEERMQTKDDWKDHQPNDRSFLFPEVLEHDKYPNMNKECKQRMFGKIINRMIDHFCFLRYSNMTNILKKFTLMLAKTILNSFDKMNLHWLKH
jgi:hypothetical protein